MVKRDLIEFDISVCLFGVEDFSGFEEKVFVVFKFVHFVGEIGQGFVEFVESLELFIDFFFYLVKEGKGTDVIVFEILVLVLKDGFNDGDFREGNFVVSDLSGDEVYLLDDFLASFDRVVEGSVERVGDGIDELDEAFIAQFRDYLVGIFLGNVQVVVFHLC